VFLWTEAVFRPQMWRLGGSGGRVRLADAPKAESTAVARDRQLVILDTTTLKPRLELTTPEPLSAVSLSPDARLLAGLDVTSALRVWDARDGQLLHTRPLADSREGCLMVPAPDSRRVALDCLDGQVLVADMRSGEIMKASETYAGSLAFLEGRGELLLGGRTGRVELWEPGAAPRLVRQYQDFVHYVLPVPGSRKLIVSVDRLVDVWDPDSDAILPLAGHTLQVSAMNISADGRRLVTSSRDNAVRVFALATGELLHTLTPGPLLAGTLALSDDGTQLAGTTHDAGILLWDLGGGPDALREPRLLAGHTGSPTVLRFAPDARSLLALDTDGGAIRWADDLPRDPVGLRAWLDAHHDPQAALAPARAGCIAKPVDAP